VYTVIYVKQISIKHATVSLPGANKFLIKKKIGFSMLTLQKRSCSWNL